MNVVVAQQDFASWLEGMRPPPLKVKRIDRAAMTPEQIETAEARDRRLIDPSKINQFIDPAQEVPSEV